MQKRHVAVIGGGAAGLMAAVFARGDGHGASTAVTVFERNEKLGKKLYITGKGRCNFTNVRPLDDFFSHIVTNPRFLYSAINGFTPEDAVSLFEKWGCPVKVERGSRAFPRSDKASDITKALTRAAKERGVEIRLDSRVAEVRVRDGRVVGIALEGGELADADAVIVATGGRSYPSTGSTGDGYAIAEALGHEIVPQEPSLVPFVTREDYVKELQGLSLKNVTLSMFAKGRKKPIFSDFGELVFTHFGISGPLVLSGSAHYKRSMGEVRCLIDLKPAVSALQLSERLERQFAENGARHFENALGGLFPGKLTPVMARLSGIRPGTKAASVGRSERLIFAQLIKALPLTVVGTRGFNEAVVTRGGVSVKGIDPRGLSSKLVSGLFFAGEIMDVDALTGGYNLQIAWSTGKMAGEAAAAYIKGLEEN